MKRVHTHLWTFRNHWKSLWHRKLTIVRCQRDDQQRIMTAIYYFIIMASHQQQHRQQELRNCTRQEKQQLKKKYYNLCRRFRQKEYICCWRRWLRCGVCVCFCALQLWIGSRLKRLRKRASESEVIQVVTCTLLSFECAENQQKNAPFVVIAPSVPPSNLLTVMINLQINLNVSVVVVVDWSSHCLDGASTRRN